MIESSRSENVEIFLQRSPTYCKIYIFQLCDNIACYLRLENKIKFIFTSSCHAS